LYDTGNKRIVAGEKAFATINSLFKISYWYLLD